MMRENPTKNWGLGRWHLHKEWPLINEIRYDLSPIKSFYRKEKNGKSDYLQDMV